MLCVVGLLFIHIVLQEPVESHMPLLKNLFLRLSSASMLAVEFPAATRREALVLRAADMYEVVRLYPQLGEIAVAERYMSSRYFLRTFFIIFTCSQHCLAHFSYVSPLFILFFYLLP